MQLLMQLHSDDENYDGPTCACIVLDREYAGWLLERVRVLNAMPKKDRPFKMVWWTAVTSAFYIDPNSDINIYDGEPHVIADDAPLPYFTPTSIFGEEAVGEDGTVRTEGEQVEVYEDSVRFTLYEKHVDVRMFTNDIPLTLLQEAAQ